MARNTTTTGGQGLSGTSSTLTDAVSTASTSGSMDTPRGGAKDTVRQVKEQAARQGSAALEGIKEGAHHLGSQAKERAGDYVEGGVHAVSRHLEDFAQAIRAASEELREKDQTMAAQIVRQAAGGLESLSRSISGTTIDDIVDSVRRFGRENPAAFIGGAVLAGLALGRFARASGRHREEEWRREGDFGQGSYQDGPYGGYSGSRGASGPYTGGSGGGGYSGSRYGTGSSSSGLYSGSSGTGGPSYGSSSRAGGSPPQSQGYAGGGVGGGSSSGPSSDRDESMARSSPSGSGLGSSSISTGENP